MKEKRNLKNYADYLFQKELSKGTISIYARQAGLLLQYLNGKPITKKAVLEYKKYLLSQNRKITTTNLYIVAVNSYLKYTGNENCTVKTERLQRNRCVENVISMEEYRNILLCAKTSGREKYYYIIRVLVFTGIRVSELNFLTVEVLSIGKFTAGNKGRSREVYLPDKLITELNHYCKGENIQSGVIFRGNRQTAISRTAVYKMLVRLAELAGVEKKKAHPHSFRHLFAITYMRQYSDLTELADILGHSSLETTRIYTATSAEEKRNKLNSLEF